VIRPLALFIVVLALMGSARAFAPAVGAPGSTGVALAVGFLVLAAIQAGNAFAAVGLPRLTGYLLTGLLCGPDVLDYVNARMVASLEIVNGVAVGLIALSAGSEINIAKLRPRLRAILLVSGVAIPLAILLCGGFCFLMAPRLPFLAGMLTAQRVTAAVTLGVVFASLSPAVALAILSETGSAGPLSEMVLGVVVLADIAIIVLFALVHGLATSVFGASGADSINPIAQLFIEIFGSMFAGAVMAWLLAQFIKRVGTQVSLVVVALCLVSAEVGARLHLDVLIICLTAGLVLENALGISGEVVHREIAPATLPIFAVFFALAGAKLHLHDLATLWPYALAIFALRAASLATGARIGTTLAQSEPAVRRWLSLGLVPQAGVSVGLAQLLAAHFPGWGASARALILAVITINELIGPVLLRFALVKSGEAGKRESSGAEH
jgi:Kef-type K+ transport system membrane component KefB